jgi:hypothetical protein
MGSPITISCSIVSWGKCRISSALRNTNVINGHRNGFLIVSCRSIICPSCKSSGKVSYIQPPERLTLSAHRRCCIRILRQWPQHFCVYQTKWGPGRGTECKMRPTKLLYLLPRHPQLAPRHRDQLIQWLNAYPGAACEQRLGLGAAEIILRHCIDQHSCVEEVFSGHSPLPGRTQTQSAKDAAARLNAQGPLPGSFGSSHGSVCTSTLSTAGKSRTIGFQLSPASGEAYTWPPVVPK